MGQIGSYIASRPYIQGPGGYRVLEVPGGTREAIGSWRYLEVLEAIWPLHGHMAVTWPYGSNFNPFLDDDRVEDRARWPRGHLTP